jgi:hypothetical protein
MPIDGEESMDMSAAADVAPEFEQLTVPQPTTDRRSTAAPAPTGMALSLVFPCYNEAERLPRTLAAYLAGLPRQPGAAEVLIVVDALGMLRDVLRVRRWAVSGGYDRAVAQAADTCTAATLGPELRRATQPS